ncbi:unnamed protein product [Prorocentrum cordatum]|uniref:Uncharacterized protein n=1 Tax=Prorocentrum cordatum TaxID=2364126 RepID=A0ABN9Q3I5_9DINO|nr:unnamed protein product [Polarella glacialis]
MEGLAPSKARTHNMTTSEDHWASMLSEDWNAYVDKQLEHLEKVSAELGDSVGPIEHASPFIIAPCTYQKIYSELQQDEFNCADDKSKERKRRVFVNRRQLSGCRRLPVGSPRPEDICAMRTRDSRQHGGGVDQVP